MGRGLQLACETCDFTAILRERAPFDANEAADGQPQRAGYWQDELCGECRLPVRRAHFASDGASERESERAAGTCPRCGRETMSFEVALRELAEACHSRVRVDLKDERRARERIEQTVGLTASLIDAQAHGDTTTLDALDTLSHALVYGTPGEEPAGPSQASGPLTATHTLGDLQREIENAASLEVAWDILRARLADSAGYIKSLEACVEDESYLPGVPCPQCETGRLIHWPIWT